MSREVNRKSFYSRSRDWDRNEYRSHQMPRKRSRSSSRDRKHRSRSPRKSEREILDENILSEISKLPEPNELWEPQFQESFTGNASAPPSSFPQEGNSYPSNYQPSYSGGYDDFTSMQSSHSQNISGWNQTQMRPSQSQQTFVNIEDQIKKEAAIESEVRHQKATLSKQREDCIKKATILKKELETLKEQRSELHSDPKRSPSPDTKRFLKENTKLQLEIQNKLKTINNVVDMLNGIIGEEASDKADLEDSGEKLQASPSNKKFNYVYYDPEMHWCRVCNEFPATAKDYLTHLHSPAHHKMASAHMEAPWHSISGVNEGFPNYPSAPTKRTPIRGLQFFVPSTAWYCKLCDQFIGDLHCASAHLKSIVHSKNYQNFVEQNPHWDTDWMSDRQKAFEKSRGKKGEDKPQYAAHTITFSKDGFHTKRKDSPPAVSSSEKKRKKKGKKKSKKKSRSSSESSSSSSSDSDKGKKTKRKKEKTVDDKVLSEWMSSIPMDSLNYNERKLLDNLKNRAEEGSVRRKSHSRDDRERREERRVDERREDRRDDRQERREDRREDRREERREDRRDERPERREDRRDDRRSDRPRSMQPSEAKKPEIKKMPFIGKMPVFKNLSKTIKTDEQKKDEEKKKQEEEVNKKRREEMDAEIQKKVAQFKEKIAKAQLEKQQELAPPLGYGAVGAVGAVAAAKLGLLPTPQMLAHPPLPPQAPNNLPKDFQDALDIIFPSASKPAEMQSDVYVGGMGAMGFPVPFPHMGLVPPQQVVVGFEHALFPPPALYDAHVPLAPKTPAADAKPAETAPPSAPNPSGAPKPNGARNKEQLDELAMLGIDASDVGAM